MAQWINMRNGVQSPRTQINQADMVTVLRRQRGFPGQTGWLDQLELASFRFSETSSSVSKVELRRASLCTHTCTCTANTHMHILTPYSMFRSWNLGALLVDYKVMQPLENGRLGIVVPAYNSSTQNADAGESPKSILSQENKSNTKCNTGDYLYVSVHDSTFRIARKETQSRACQW